MTKYLYLSVVALVAAAAASAVVAVADTVPTASALVTTTLGARKLEKSRAAKVNGTCMQATVEKRDSALVGVVDTFHNKVSADLTTRKDALKTAWGLTDLAARRTALKKAWEQYRKDTRNARNTLKIARSSAWKTFQTDAKACGGSAAVEDGGNEAMDINL